VLTRFAPSPTGLLHLGHAFSALTVWRVAEELGGTALLRIEDTDSTRCRPGFEDAIHEDLHWLGLDWPRPVRRQSEHLADYAETLDTLAARGLLYPCSCSRKQIAQAGAQPGWDGRVYPGTCRHRPMADARPGDALRLNLAAALDAAGPLPAFTETGPLRPGRHRPDPQALLSGVGDPVLRRKQTGDPAYHLACPQDDAAQQITHVVRGADLWNATFLHVVLQTLMGWPVPTYHHHDLVRDEGGTRLAKIAHSRAIRAYREDGLTPRQVKALVGF
jgi:glutamyl-Q tRNA(Asp) synthetase